LDLAVLYRFTAIALAAFSLLPGFPAMAADLEMHAAPLPLNDDRFGNPKGCLMAMGDEPDGAALWLTPREIGGVDSNGSSFQCIFLTWYQDSVTGLMSLDCDQRRFLILPRTEAASRKLTVIELLGNQAFATHELVRCGPE
jgi:hypothetical protein